MDQSSVTTSRFSKLRMTKVPEITIWFWIAKLVTTAMGEALSDFLVFRWHLGHALIWSAIPLVVFLIIQFSVRKYIAWIYWSVVALVATFGTAVADSLQIVWGFRFWVSSIFFAMVLTAIFILWYKSERTLSIHSIYTVKREMFYWCTVIATFMLGTTSGDMMAGSFHLGFWHAFVVFGILLLIPGALHDQLGVNAIFTFWFAYIMTRPVGAEFADLISKPKGVGGFGWGYGPVSLGLFIVMASVVGYLIYTRLDVQKEDPERLEVQNSLENPKEMTSEVSNQATEQLISELHETIKQRDYKIIKKIEDLEQKLIELKEEKYTELNKYSKTKKDFYDNWFENK